MIEGVITCKCGQLFGFATASEKIYCPTCACEFIAKDYGTEVVETQPEEIIEKVEE